MAVEEAGEGDKKLVEEDACADLAEEQAGVHLRGESSSLNRFLWAGLLVYVTPLFPLLCSSIFVPSRPNFGSALGLVPVLLFPAQPAPALSMAFKSAQSNLPPAPRPEARQYFNHKLNPCCHP